MGVQGAESGVYLVGSRFIFCASVGVVLFFPVEGGDIWRVGA